MGKYLSIQRHAVYVLAAAALFGASAPVAKLLLEQRSALSLAALAYCGGGIALAIAWLVRRIFFRAASKSASSWSRREIVNLAGAIVSGGVLAPTILFWSLFRIAASSASLLLSFEGLLTAVLAAALFREAIDRRVWFALVLMVIAAGTLSLGSIENSLLFMPAAGVILASGLWALDNNLTRSVSHRDALGITAMKCLVAGMTNAAIVLTLDDQLFVTLSSTFAGLGLGALSYGLSLVLFVSALAHLGSARTSAHFGTAPFFGAALAVLMGEPLTTSLLAAVALTAVSTWIVLTERHEHLHTHESTEHEHMHAHDDHHLHTHRGDEGPEPHRHTHQHEAQTHSHAHLPDLHHRHSH